MFVVEFCLDIGMRSHFVCLSICAPNGTDTSCMTLLFWAGERHRVAVLGNRISSLGSGLFFKFTFNTVAPTLHLRV